MFALVFVNDVFFFLVLPNLADFFQEVGIHEFGLEEESSPKVNDFKVVRSIEH